MKNTEENLKWYGKYGTIVCRIVIRNGQYRRKASWNVKWYVHYGRKISWIVKRYEKYGRKPSSIVIRFGKCRWKLWNDTKNMEERQIK